MKDKLKILFHFIQQWQQVLNVLLFLVISGFIYSIIQQKNEGLQQIFSLVKEIAAPEQMAILCLVVLLTPFNWAFEALKWQLLVSKVEKTSFIDAYKGVLAGLALSSTTPLMAGDYAAKILLLKSKKRGEGVGAVLMSGFLQLLVSIFYGTLAYSFFIFQKSPSPIVLHYSLLALLTLFIGLCAYFILNGIRFKAIFTKFPVLKFSEPYFKVLEVYKTQEILEAFLMASIRYFIFTTQFVLVLFLCKIDLPIATLFCGASTVFLIKTIVPFLNFASDFGVRQLASFYFFSFYDVNSPSILLATTLIWIINILLPMLVGVFFILNFRFVLNTQNADN